MKTRMWEKNRKRDMGKVRAKSRAGWRHPNGAPGGTTCTGPRCGQLVSHTSDLSHSTGTLKECLSRQGVGGEDSLRLGGSHAHLTSHPAVTLVCFHVYLKKDKRYDCSGMKTWATSKQRKAETAVSDDEGNVNQP